MVQQRCREWSKTIAEGGGAVEAASLVEKLWQVGGCTLVWLFEVGSHTYLVRMCVISVLVE
jgi:hypothetical protein